MATYKEIVEEVLHKENRWIHTCWIAHVKELSGLRLRLTHNRHDSTRVDPCPPERRAAIEEALQHFGIL